MSDAKHLFDERVLEFCKIKKSQVELIDPDITIVPYKKAYLVTFKNKWSKTRSQELRDLKGFYNKTLKGFIFPGNKSDMLRYYYLFGYYDERDETKFTKNYKHLVELLHTPGEARMKKMFGEIDFSKMYNQKTINDLSKKYIMGFQAKTDMTGSEIMHRVLKHRGHTDFKYSDKRYDYFFGSPQDQKERLEGYANRAVEHGYKNSFRVSTYYGD